MSGRVNKLPAATAPLARPREQQLLPGVYFTPAPSMHAHTTLSSHMPVPVSDLSLPDLEREHDELDNSLRHLLRSNAEIRDIDPNRSDPDLALALSENHVLIERRRARLHDLAKRIEVLSASCAPSEAPSSTSTAPRVTESSIPPRVQSTDADIHDEQTLDSGLTL